MLCLGYRACTYNSYQSKTKHRESMLQQVDQESMCNKPNLDESE